MYACLYVYTQWSSTRFANACAALLQSPLHARTHVHTLVSLSVFGRHAQSFSTLDSFRPFPQSPDGCRLLLLLLLHSSSSQLGSQEMGISFGGWFLFSFQ